MISTAKIFCIAFGLSTVIWVNNLILTWKDISKKRARKIEKTNMEFHLILPVLNENERLTEFVKYFLDTLRPLYPHMQLWVVTTEKELVNFPGSNTIALAINYGESSDAIHHLHSPYADGIMAHQLNFALRHLPNTGVVAIYNADSRPEKETFAWVASEVRSDTFAFQQPGIFTKNFNYMQIQKFSGTLLANSLWQCRWALGLEYYRAMASLWFRKLPRLFRPFSYCVGHGLIVDTATIKRIGFRETVPIEDSVFGLELAMEYIPLQPIPYFDLSESPDSIKSIYLQKTVWFQAAYLAFKYYRNVTSRHINNKLLNFVDSIKLFALAIRWIIGPVGLVASYIFAGILCFQNNFIEAILLGVISTSFLAFPLILTVATMRHFHIQDEPLTDKNACKPFFLKLVLGAILAYIVHGAAGIRGVLLSKKIQRGFKPKTFMSQYNENTVK